MKMPMLAVALLALSTFAPAKAAVVTALPGGTPVVIPPLHEFGPGPREFAPGVTFRSTRDSSVVGWASNYGFFPNGLWFGQPMIGLNAFDGTFELAFADPIRGYLGETNWGVGEGGDVKLEIFDAANTLLESLLLEHGGGNVVLPGYWGFLRDSADISYVRFSNESIGVRNISVLADQPAAVPESASWAMMLIGFGFAGGMMRSARRQKVSVTYA